jgi:hypothetical protein
VWERGKAGWHGASAEMAREGGGAGLVQGRGVGVHRGGPPFDSSSELWPERAVQLGMWFVRERQRDRGIQTHNTIFIEHKSKNSRKRVRPASVRRGSIKKRLKLESL